MNLLNRTKNRVIALYSQPSTRTIINVSLFALITALFHYIWWGGLVQLLANYSWFEGFRAFMVQTVFTQSVWINEHIFGLKMIKQGVTMIFPNVGYITIEEACSGTKQFYQILVLFILFPGPWRHKLWYIPSAMLVMHMVNVARILILSLVLFVWPEQWDFIHLWILRPGYYVVIFLMWVLWIELFPIRFGAKTVTM